MTILIISSGGNNALIIHEDAQFDMALDAAFFGCIGTAGQRCTTTRRLIVHEKLYDAFLQKLVQRYKGVSVELKSFHFLAQLLSPL